MGAQERPETLTGLIEGAAEARPDGPAFPGSAWAGGWADAAAAVRRLSGGLSRLGVGAGDRVAIWLPNRPEYLLLQFALARLGACAVHVNTRFRAAELGSLLTRSRPVALVTAADFPAVDFLGLLPDLPEAARAALRVVVASGAGTRQEVAGLKLHDLASLFEGAEAPDSARPEAPCLTFTTSGTTAGPKLVLHRQRSIAGHAHDVMRAIGTDVPEAVLFAAVPFCGTFGLTAAMAAVAGAARILPMARFEAREADALIRAHRATHMVGGDDLLLMLAEAAQGRPHTPFIFTGFAAFHGQAARVMEASDALNLAVRGVYGSSELQALFALQDPSDPAHRAIGGGRPTSAEAAVRLGPEGLEFRGPSLFSEYLGNPDATARARTEDGWFRSGDLGTLHPDGRGFDFATRAGDALRLGGFLVAPEEIEGFCTAQPGIAAAQVVAAHGQPVAFVIPGPGFDAERLMAAARRELARFKVPVRIVPLDAFPVVEGPNGVKIQRGRLREMAESLLDAPA